MSLLKKNHQLSYWNPSSLVPQTGKDSPISEGTAKNAARIGRATWNLNCLTIGNTGNSDYYYVPQNQDGVSFCVVPFKSSNEIYVVSDQFGGCEWHVYFNTTTEQLAFLHVFRGRRGKFDGTSKYKVKKGWSPYGEIRSMGLIRRLGTAVKNNLALSYVVSDDYPNVQNQFISTGDPNSATKLFTVEEVDHGLEPNEG